MEHEPPRDGHRDVSQNLFLIPAGAQPLLQPSPGRRVLTRCCFIDYFKEKIRSDADAVNKDLQILFKNKGS